MKLQEQIKQDLANVAKETGSIKKELLKVIVAEISRSSTKNVEDDEVLRIIRKMKENAIECGNHHEIPILNEYLPQMLSENEITDIIKTIVNTHKYSTIKDMGNVMKELKLHNQANLIDNKIASQIVKLILTT